MKSRANCGVLAEGLESLIRNSLQVGDGILLIFFTMAGLCLLLGNISVLEKLGTF